VHKEVYLVPPSALQRQDADRLQALCYRDRRDQCFPDAAETETAVHWAADQARRLDEPAAHRSADTVVERQLDACLAVHRAGLALSPKTHPDATDIVV